MIAVHGRHVILDVYKADRELLDDPVRLRTLLYEAAQVAGANVKGEHFEKFHPQGVTGVLVLAESHLTIHTYPEYSYAAVDCFTCGRDCDPLAACVHLVERLGESCRGVVVYLFRPADGCFPQVGHLSRDRGKVVFHAHPV